MLHGKAYGKQTEVSCLPQVHATAIAMAIYHGNTYLSIESFANTCMLMIVLQDWKLGDKNHIEPICASSHPGVRQVDRSE